MPSSSMEARQQLLARYAALRTRQSELLGDLSRDPEHVAPENLDELERVGTEIGALREQYLDSLPVVALSRSPMTGDMLEYAIDTAGLDGLWWDAVQPVRPLQQGTTDLVGLAGAMRLGSPLEVTPFEVRPGPEVPYVVPRLLALPGVHAVVSQVSVGVHTGYVMTYFAEHPEEVPRRVNTWGTDSYEVIRPDGTLAWSQDDDSAFLDRDYDLEPWIRAGKLLWIAPGDTSLLLRAETVACPYLALPGSRRDRTIADGVCTEDEEVPFVEDVIESSAGQPVPTDPVPDELWRTMAPELPEGDSDEQTI